MKISELKGRPVISLADATKIGEVEDLMVDVASHRIVGLKVRTGLLSAPQIIPAGAVRNIGADAVTLNSDSAVADAAAETPAVTLTSILGTKVVTDDGTLVGDLSDVLFDWANLAISGYEVRGGGMFAKAQEFGNSPDVRFGDKLITIPAQLLSPPA